MNVSLSQIAACVTPGGTLVAKCWVSYAQWIVPTAGTSFSFFQAMTRAKKIYTEGCLKGFHHWIEGHILVIGYMFSAIVIPEVRNLLMTD